MPTKPKRISGVFILALIVAVLIFGYAYKRIQNHYGNFNTSPNLPPPNSLTINPPPDTPPSAGDENIKLPPSKLLSVPFTPQAPTANWDELHNEACEETSSIMANAFFNPTSEADTNKDGVLEPAYVEKEIARLTEWQQDSQGYSLDQTSEEVAKMIREVYKLNAKVTTDISADTFKQELNQGRLILLSADGRELGNPYYRQPGPPHHMFVIKGYTNDGFVTNDPGTRRGQSYPFSYATLKAAAGDWDHSIDAVDLKVKNAIIVWK